MEIIGIAGGSGAGKSTVSYELQDENPSEIEVLNFDDYQMVAQPRPANIPMVGDMINWDHPDIIHWGNLIRDIQTLRSGRPITILSWAHRSNPDYFLYKNFVERTVEPKPILIIEGYLALYKPELRKLYDTSFYLDIDETERQRRRREARGSKDTIIPHGEYVEKVLKPMHRKYVEPTKAYADHVIDATDLSVAAICTRIRTLANI